MIIKKNFSFFIKSNIDFYIEKGFGKKINDKLELTAFEVIYIVKKYKEDVLENKQKIPLSQLENLVDENDYIVFEYLRNSGHIILSGLKYGFTFRVYEKGIKPKDDHSKWLVYTQKVQKEIHPLDLISKARIANTVKKRILLAIVDTEKNINFYEYNWKRL